MAYCIAFSYDGCTDVTRRYVRNPRTQLLPRVRCPEEVLLWILHEIRKARRENLPKQELFRLEKEDMDEEQELRAYQASALAMEIGDIGPNTGLPTGLPFDPVREEEKRPRQSGKFPLESFAPKRCLRSVGAPEWTYARGEDGTGRVHPHLHQPRGAGGSHDPRRF